jgi:predicted transcriptional regulator
LNRTGGDCGLSSKARRKAALNTLVDGIDLRAFIENVDRGRAHRAAVNFGVTHEMQSGTWLRAAHPRRVGIPAAPATPNTISIGKASYELSPAAAEVLAHVQERDAVTLGAAQAALAHRSAEDVRQAVSQLAQQGLILVDA